jgi:hypothetical protein
MKQLTATIVYSSPTGERAALRAWYASLETPVLDAGLE